MKTITRREIVRDRGGVLVTFDEADYFKHEVSPHLQSEERLIVDTIISQHLNKPPEKRFTRSSDGKWNEIYNSYGGTPFTKQDSLPSNVFSDLTVSG
jgi:hypothetical protein